MPHFNVATLGMRGRLHPAVTNVITTHGVRKMRSHVKMLTGNFLTFEIKSGQSGGSPFCRLCESENDSKPASIESLEHLIAQCDYFNDMRQRITSLMSNLCKEAKLDIKLSELSDGQLTQFILDPSSLNLKRRVAINHPLLPTLFQLSRDFCYGIDKSRSKKLSL